MHDIEITDVELCDVPELSNLFSQIISDIAGMTEEAKREQIKGLSVEKISARVQNQSRRYRVAKTDNVMAGVLSFEYAINGVFDCPWFPEILNTDGYIEWLGVSEGYKGTGIGSALMRDLFNYAGENNLRHYVCAIADENIISEQFFKKWNARRSDDCLINHQTPAGVYQGNFIK